MSSLQQVILWNRRRWEKKNRLMYATDSENRWPWYSEKLDEDVSEFLAGSPAYVDVLDLGTCSGSQAIGLAQKGYNVVGTDVSESALRQAEALKRALGDAELKLTFELDDIVTTRFANDSFDVIFDRGCYHSICCFSHDLYAQQVKRILRPDGVLLLKTMSIGEERFGEFERIDDVDIPMPCKFDAESLRKVFSDYFDIAEIRDSFFYSSVVDPPARAMFAILKNNK